MDVCAQADWGSFYCGALVTLLSSALAIRKRWTPRHAIDILLDFHQASLLHEQYQPLRIESRRGLGGLPCITHLLQVDDMISMIVHFIQNIGKHT
jgi:hypothetical protein